jgi:hypothetical protein
MTPKRTPVRTKIAVALQRRESIAALIAKLPKIVRRSPAAADIQAAQARAPVWGARDRTDGCIARVERVQRNWALRDAVQLVWIS